MANAVAKVVFESPLPALDREFEYLVPETLQDQIRIGVRVKVPFARQAKVGFVVSLSPTAQFNGKLSYITEVVSDVPVLQPHIYQLLREISHRQCCSTGELIASAVPTRSVKVEKLFEYLPHSDNSTPEGIRQTKIVRPFASESTGNPSGYLEIARLAASEFSKGLSVLVILPDFRDVLLFGTEIRKLVPTYSLIEKSHEDVPSETYSKFLRQLGTKPLIVFGTRSVIYSPVAPTSSIIVWEDSDQSHTDKQSPYLNSREIALIRQRISNANLYFYGYSRSTEVQRLVQIGYLATAPTDTWRPRVIGFEGPRLDSGSYSLIKRGLESGPVLVQVASPGISRSLYCGGCSERSSCSACFGPLWMNAQGHATCRWCGRINLDFKCRLCGEMTLKQGSAGSTRWATQLGKSFPGVPVREVTSDDRDVRIRNTKQIVIATPGIEPPAEAGYAALLVIDGHSTLNRDSLRAAEDALRVWLTSMSFVRQTGQVGIIGLSSEVEKAFTLGEVEATVASIFLEREELGFPPSRRVLSAVGSLPLLERLAQELSKIKDVRVLGISKSQFEIAENDYRLVATFTYSGGVEIASQVKNFLASIAGESNRVSVKSGRAMRPIAIRFDDPQVI